MTRKVTGRTPVPEAIDRDGQKTPGQAIADIAGELQMLRDPRLNMEEFMARRDDLVRRLRRIAGRLGVRTAPNPDTRIWRPG